MMSFTVVTQPTFSYTLTMPLTYFLNLESKKSIKC